MPFVLRPYRRFPLCCPMTYHAGLSEGRGTIWNVSLNGWRLSGDLPLRVRQTGSMTIKLSNHQNLGVAGAIVCWVKSQEYGLETLVTEKHTHCQLEHFGERVVLEPTEVIHE